MKIISLAFWVFVAYVVFNWHSSPDDAQSTTAQSQSDLPIPIPKAPPPSISEQISSNGGKPTDALLMSAAEGCRFAVSNNWSGYGDPAFSFKNIMSARYSYSNGVIDVVVPFSHQNMYGAKEGDYAECNLRAKGTEWAVISHKP